MNNMQKTLRFSRYPGRLSIEIQCWDVKLIKPLIYSKCLTYHSNSWFITYVFW